MRTPEVYWILGSLLAVLCIASLVSFELKRRRPSHPLIDNVNARIRAWWVLVVVGGGALLIGTPAVIALFAYVSFAALREYVRDCPPVLLLTIPLQYGLLALGFNEPFLLIIAALWLYGRREQAGGVFVCVYCLSHVPALMMGPFPLLAFFVVLIAQGSDVLQFLSGKALGRHPVAPSISPSKTMEGLVGGVACATALGALLWRITPFSPSGAAAMAFLIAILGFIGGLILSAIKRRRGLKDWSGLIQGHGGMLDRVDSLWLSAPVIFHLTHSLVSQPR